MILLKYVIEMKRKELFAVVNKYGICSKEVVKMSQELDILLNNLEKSMDALTFDQKTLNKHGVLGEDEFILYE